MTVPDVVDTVVKAKLFDTGRPSDVRCRVGARVGARDKDFLSFLDRLGQLLCAWKRRTDAGTGSRKAVVPARVVDHRFQKIFSTLLNQAVLQILKADYLLVSSRLKVANQRLGNFFSVLAARNLERLSGSLVKSAASDIGSTGRVSWTERVFVVGEPQSTVPATFDWPPADSVSYTPSSTNAAFHHLFSCHEQNHTRVTETERWQGEVSGWLPGLKDIHFGDTSCSGELVLCLVDISHLLEHLFRLEISTTPFLTSRDISTDMHINVFKVLDQVEVVRKGLLQLVSIVYNPSRRVSTIDVSIKDDRPPWSMPLSNRLNYPRLRYVTAADTTIKMAQGRQTTLTLVKTLQRIIHSSEAASLMAEDFDVRKVPWLFPPRHQRTLLDSSLAWLYSHKFKTILKLSEDASSLCPHQPGFASDHEGEQSPNTFDIWRSDPEDYCCTRETRSHVKYWRIQRLEAKIASLSEQVDQKTALSMRLSPTSSLSRRYLPIQLNGQDEDALPDTGSVENVMTLDRAQALGATIRRLKRPKTFVNAVGQKFTSKHQAVLQCSFPGDAAKPWQCVFSLVSGLAMPLVVGSEFLAKTETLTRFKHRLRKMIKHGSTPWRVLHMEIPRHRLGCRVDGEEVLANADTGSNVDLMSPSYALKREYPYIPCKAGEEHVQLADGSISKLAGRVTVALDVGDSALDVDSGQGRSGHGARRTFYILEGLTSDVLLGDTTLDELDAFDTHSGSFVDVTQFVDPQVGDTHCDDHVDELCIRLDLVIMLASKVSALDLPSLLEDARLTSTQQHAGTASTGTGAGVTAVSSSFPSSVVRVFGRRRSNPSATSQVKRAADIIGNEAELRRYVNFIDNRNSYLAEQAETRIASMPSGPERDTEEATEKERARVFHENRAELIRLHQDAARVKK